MKTVIYTRNALKDLTRYRNMASRVRRVMDEYAADPLSHANNVTQLLGSAFKRIRVGNFRVVLSESDTEILVIKAGPRGDVHG